MITKTREQTKKREKNIKETEVATQKKKTRKAIPKMLWKGDRRLIPTLNVEGSQDAL